jgi:FkbM family methyltransferase
MQASAGDITIDCRTGAIAGATALEWLALKFIGLSARILEPVHRFGLSRIVRAVGYLVGSSKGMVFQLAEDSRMRTPFCDPYWTPLVVPNMLYRLNLTKIVEGFRDIDFGFIDGGANYGCWSILVSGWKGNAKPALAVEAASDTFGRLAENCSLNGNRFRILNRAISDRSGDTVLIYGDRHEARSILPDDASSAPVSECLTISLDDLLQDTALAGVSRFVVKLDIEGMETQAMQAASALLRKDAVFIYEDHGSDRTHHTTATVLEKIGLRVFWLGDGNAREISDPAGLDAIKASRRYGYDLAATRSPFWIEKLEAMVSQRSTGRVSYAG